MAQANRRVARLLLAAARYGHDVEQSTNVSDCWTVRGNLEHSLTIYGGENNSARVMADLPGRTEWEQIPQRAALNVLSSGILWAEGSFPGDRERTVRPATDSERVESIEAHDHHGRSPGQPRSGRDAE